MKTEILLRILMMCTGILCLLLCYCLFYLIEILYMVPMYSMFWYLTLLFGFLIITVMGGVIMTIYSFCDRSS